MEPITRQEQLLDSIATGNSVELEPITREEMYLSAIAGSTDLIPEKPITRKEMFYEKILESGGVGGDGTAKPTQTKTIEVVENGTYKVTPDSGKVLSSVTAKVNVPERYEEGYQAGYTEGYQKGQGDNDFVTEPLEVTKNGTYTPSEGVDGFETVSVKVPERYDEGFAEGKEEGYNEGYNKGFADNEPVLEALTATENKEYTPSDNVDGFSSVTVNVPLKYDEGFQAGVDSVKLQEKTVTENGDVLPDSGFSGMSKVTVAVPTGSSKEEQEKSITITKNGTTEVTPDEGKTLSKVTIETSVPTGGSGEVGKPYIDTSKMVNFSNFIANNKGLIEDLDKLDTSNGTNFSNMFKGCENLKTIPQLDTSNGTNFGSMFYECGELEAIPQFDTSNGTNFNSMFYECGELEAIPQFDTSNGTGFGGIFENCTSLKTIPQLDTSKGTNFTSMFYNCQGLETIPQLDTSKGTNFGSMFSNCRLLTTTPLLDTSKGTSFSSMFHTCSSLESVSLTTAKSDFSTNSFQNCTALTNLTIGEGWAVSIYLTYSNNLSVESLHGMIENLADLTGKTAKKFQVGTTNLAKIDEEHIAMLQAKNWNYS